MSGYDIPDDHLYQPLAIGSPVKGEECEECGSEHMVVTRGPHPLSSIFGHVELRCGACNSQQPMEWKRMQELRAGLVRWPD